MDPKNPERKLDIRNNVLAGFASGTAQSIIGHPYDRALFLALTNHRPFFDKLNWQKPFHAITSSVMLRSITAGSYFGFQGMLSPLKESLQEEGFSEDTARIIHGLTAGSLNGSLTNPLTYTRYFAWQNDNPSFTHNASKLYQAGGINIFSRGVMSGLVRDLKFGAVYEYARPKLKSMLNANGSKSKEFTANMMAASAAILLASPYNYMRNIMYKSDPTRPPPSIKEATKSLFFHAKADSASPLAFILRLQNALQIGPGIVRFAFGMALGQMVCDYVKEQLNDEDTESDHSTSAPKI
jgi:hypothetical protein